ncbi:hypothetical protein G6F50_015832 [Rhizopus delemar]|uniref:Uncharacterized protein n=1 Tax=Rhizopus delemar TaxID=936053 RepID=A0A9P6XWA5_9FUNG|nr:hypothetical protein G6F50_015832 [Rhizopus delemar]
MPVKIGLTEDGRATPALQKKLAAKGLENIDLSTLARESDGKQDYLVARGTAPGAQLAAGHALPAGRWRHVRQVRAPGARSRRPVRRRRGAGVRAGPYGRP